MFLPHLPTVRKNLDDKFTFLQLIHWTILHLDSEPVKNYLNPCPNLQNILHLTTHSRPRGSNHVPSNKLNQTQLPGKTNGLKDLPRSHTHTHTSSFHPQQIRADLAWLGRQQQKRQQTMTVSVTNNHMWMNKKERVRVGGKHVVILMSHNCFPRPSSFELLPLFRHPQPHDWWWKMLLSGGDGVCVPFARQNFTFYHRSIFIFMRFFLEKRWCCENGWLLAEVAWE